jgi:8-oxo-dGTP pyrophosphatase MutT (NUDIX family)
MKSESMIESISCPSCEWTSFHPKDVQERWCGRCEKSIPHFVKEYVVVYCWARMADEWSILLVLKNRPPLLAGRLNLPGGKVEPGEDWDKAAVRELKEETGLDAINVDYEGRIDVQHDAIGDHAIIYCYKIEVDYYQMVSPRSEETEIVRWYDWRKVVTDPRLMPNLRLIVPLIRAGIDCWQVNDSLPSWGKSQHEVKVQVPTYH